MKKLSLYTLSSFFLLAGCSSGTDLNDVQFVHSQFVFNPMPTFAITLENENNQEIDVAYELSFFDDGVNEYFEHESASIHAEIPNTIPGDQEFTFSVNLEEVPPDDILENMYDFDLNLQEFDGDEIVNERTIEVRAE
ncbi:hypothetical protein [Shouchella hunanensis]|uniref:Lipoprotein n=1 Tax=Shouchella hunanensis TaxID=766894 RepID=A0ABY7WE21_9BACI|nr:hypothetical protein [Shouchella hunanensis]WDF04905.1 hypothetical protein PQ477_05435 [Shouchella hunanensis]